MSLDTMTAAAIPQLLGLVEKTWGYRNLRPLQQEAMEAILDKRDSVVVMPTGGGKSLCYQAPAVYLSGLGHGPTVVVSPLIALMKDQVDSLRALGIPAGQLDSSLSADQRRAVTQDLRNGRLAILFVSPEKLVGSLASAEAQRGDELNSGATVNPTLAMLQQAGVRTFAIDEAHCISHWGHDFRPEYRRLAMLKSFFPGCSIHAFTATATEQVRHDIATQLQLDNPARLVGNFDRPNLVYRVLPRRDVLGQIREVLERHNGEAGIIYCLRRKDVDEMAAAIQVANKTSGHRALGYHAGMAPDVRRNVQEAFAQEQCDLIVATVAFGMGIDRSNIRFVLHAGMPKSIEAYQQETGRAGRDGLEAECVLLYSGQDVMTWKSLIEKSADDAETRGTAVSPDYIPTAMRHLEDMDRFARGAVCRHKALVEYFGQTYLPPGAEAEAGIQATPDMAANDSNSTDSPVNSVASCRACDHCLGDTESVPDALVIAQKVLSAVARTEQRFGAGQIIAVLRGENNAKVRQFKHDTLSVHGLLKNHSAADLRNFIYQLIGQGVLAQENLILSDGHAVPIIKLNPASVEVMKGQRSVRLIQLAKKPSEGEIGLKTGEVSWQGVDRGLFEELRGLRRTLAAQRHVPPHIIYSDATLRQLARVRPVDRKTFRNIYGIGETKLRDLGEKTIAFIADYATAHLLPTNVPNATPQPVAQAAVPVVSRPSVTKSMAMSLFESGRSVADVSRQTGRAVSTVSEYLAEYILTAQPDSIEAWVPEPVYQRVAAAIKKHGGKPLKPVFIALNETVPYEQIRLVAAHLQCGKASNNS